MTVAQRPVQNLWPCQPPAPTTAISQKSSCRLGRHPWKRPRVNANMSGQVTSAFPSTSLLARKSPVFLFGFSSFLFFSHGRSNRPSGSCSNSSSGIVSSGSSTAHSAGPGDPAASAAAGVGQDRAHTEARQQTAPSVFVSASAARKPRASASAAWRWPIQDTGGRWQSKSYFTVQSVREWPADPLLCTNLPPADHRPP